MHGSLTCRCEAVFVPGTAVLCSCDRGPGACKVCHIHSLALPRTSLPTPALCKTMHADFIEGAVGIFGGFYNLGRTSYAQGSQVMQEAGCQVKWAGRRPEAGKPTERLLKEPGSGSQGSALSPWG